MSNFSDICGRRLFRAAAMLLLPAQLLGQGFEGIVSVRSASMPADATMEYFLKGDRLRLEVRAPGQPPIVLISDGPAKKQYTLFLDQKAYTTMTFAELLKSTDSLRKRASELVAGASMTPSQTLATVAGHRCKVYRYHDAKNTYDICLTTELGAVSGVPGLFGNITPTIDLSTPPAWTQSFVKAGSFALRVADTTGNTIWEVRKVVAQALAPSLFVVPAGFASASDPADGSKPPASP